LRKWGAEPCKAMTPAGPGLSGDEFSDHQEIAEVPPTQKANPGHLWSATEAEFDVQVGLQSLYELMRNQHREVLDRLAVQDKALSQTIKRPKKRNPDLSEPLATPKEQGGPTSATASPVSKGRRFSRPPQELGICDGLESHEEPYFSPTIFKSFSQTERNLHISAANAHANHLRKRFAELGFVTGTHRKRDTTSCAQRIVDHPAFDIFFALAVIANSVFIGVEVQILLDNYGKPTDLAVQVARDVFVGLFFIELLLRILADGFRQYWGSDWMWMWLDTIVVLSSLWELGVDIAFYIQDQDGIENPALAGVTGFKAFRIIRITRIVKTVRILRVFRFVMAFRTLITSILHTIQSLCWALLLLVLIMYVFAVLFTQAVNGYILDGNPMSAEDHAASLKYFSSVADTMLSLFMSVAGGVSWEVISPLKSIGVMWVFAFLVYMSFTYFAVLNVVTAVFCQKAMDNAQNDHVAVVQSMLANKEAHLKKMSALFSQLGADEDGGVITFAMFEEQINNPAVKAYFETLGLDIWDAWSFFKLLDLDGGGAVELEEFFRGCLRLHGQARSIDIGTVMHDQRWLIRNQGQFHGYVESQLKALSEQMSLLTGRRYKMPDIKEHVARPRYSVRQTEIVEQSDVSGISVFSVPSHSSG